MLAGEYIVILSVKKYRVVGNLKIYTDMECIPGETLRKIYIGNRNRRSPTKFSVQSRYITSPSTLSNLSNLTISVLIMISPLSFWLHSSQGLIIEYVSIPMKAICDGGIASDIWKCLRSCEILSTRRIHKIHLGHEWLNADSLMSSTLIGHIS